jgi:ubiquinone/menaquinone biosynthesis C-methylase UbiE
MIKKILIKMFENAQNLNKETRFNDNSFDVVHFNQVFEHLCHLDLFVSEIKRILEVGGYGHFPLPAVI